MTKKQYHRGKCNMGNRIIYNILGSSAHPAFQTNLHKQNRQNRQDRQTLQFVGDVLGGISLFLMLFIGLFAGLVFS